MPPPNKITFPWQRNIRRFDRVLPFCFLLFNNGSLHLFISCFIVPSCNLRRQKKVKVKQFCTFLRSRWIFMHMWDNQKDGSNGSGCLRRTLYIRMYNIAAFYIPNKVDSGYTQTCSHIAGIGSHDCFDYTDVTVVTYTRMMMKAEMLFSY